ncbi:MAG: hypothetical protein RMJ54_18630 [Roseiflexaceae bacterium]|nr:hypothetical protein [Roseiflexaceae bacterium]MDW8234792.1 hypothetical protein [Roseiflexaceae bacterium]
MTAAHGGRASGALLPPTCADVGALPRWARQRRAPTFYLHCDV